MVKAAVKDPIPPIDSDSAMATGAVVDFGARDSANTSLPPKALVTVTVTTIAVIEPVSTQAATTQPAWLMLAA